jgi:hypothetical protein
MLSKWEAHSGKSTLCPIIETLTGSKILPDYFSAHRLFPHFLKRLGCRYASETTKAFAGFSATPEREMNFEEKSRAEIAPSQFPGYASEE